MRAFADLLETVAAAADTTAARDLTTVENVKAALRMVDSASDTLITALITRASALIAEHCRLASDASGAAPAFGRETLRATWYAERSRCRGCDLYLPWRVPVFSIDSVVEADATLTAGTDFVLIGAKGGVVRRMSSDCPADWSAGKIVVTWKAGFSTTSTLAANIAPNLEAACIEQVKAMLMGADRDPAIRSESMADVGAMSYALPGGDTFSGVLLPQVVDAVAPWRNPLP